MRPVRGTSSKDSRAEELPFGLLGGLCALGRYKSEFSTSLPLVRCPKSLARLANECFSFLIELSIISMRAVDLAVHAEESRLSASAFPLLALLEAEF